MKPLRKLRGFHHLFFRFMLTLSAFMIILCPVRVFRFLLSGFPFLPFVVLFCFAPYATAVAVAHRYRALRSRNLFFEPCGLKKLLGAKPLLFLLFGYLSFYLSLCIMATLPCRLRRELPV